MNITAEILSRFQRKANALILPKRAGGDCCSASRAHSFRGGLALMVVLFCFFLLPQLAPAQNLWEPDDYSALSQPSRIEEQLSVIALIRDRVSSILESDNACSEWFREADPESPEIFRSLQFEIDVQTPSFILHQKDGDGGNHFKHPWTAKTMELAGRNSIVYINPGGAFFNPKAMVKELDRRLLLSTVPGNHVMTIGAFSGGTQKAQIIAMLHELGHVVGRIPADSDSWDGRSSRNTEQVMRHCHREIRSAAKNQTEPKMNHPSITL